MLCINFHPAGSEGRRDDDETENVAISEQALEAVRQGDSRWFTSAGDDCDQRRARRDPDFGADNQRDLGEAPKGHDGTGQSVGVTTALPGQTRFAATRKRCDTAGPQAS